MGLFERNPEIRVWAKHSEEALRKADDNDPDSLVSVLYTFLLKQIGNFFQAPKTPDMTEVYDAVFREAFDSFLSKERAYDDMRKMHYKDSRRFDNDWCIFEAFCYVASKLDLWLFLEGRKEFRDKIFNKKILPHCLEVFQDILKTETVFRVFNNRVKIYAVLARQHAEWEKELHYFTQFIFKIENSKKVEEFDIEGNFPLFIGDAFAGLTVAIHLAAYMKAVVPILKNAVDMLDKKLAAIDQI